MLAVAAGNPPGMTLNGTLAYNHVAPSILSIDATEITLSWPMCTGNQPLPPHHPTIYIQYTHTHTTPSPLHCNPPTPLA